MFTHCVRGLARYTPPLLTHTAPPSDGPNVNMTAAIKQWRCLCHLAVINVAIITKLEFGVITLLDYHTTEESLNADKDGLGGIRLSQSNIPALGCSIVEPRLASVTLAAQLLSLLDAFIFPSNSKKLGKSYGMTLVRATENRLGQSQGPLLCSLVRLSVLLISHLEPCSLRFLHACGRLRTFCRWLLAMIRENGSSLGGVTTPFTEATAHLDRLVVAIVLHAHRALEKCARLMSVFESDATLFKNSEDKKKTSRRVMKASHELREVVVFLVSNNAELLRLSLAPQAYADLKEAVEAGKELVNDLPPSDQEASKNKAATAEAVLRKFLNSAWVRRWHDMEGSGDDLLPVMVSNSQQGESGHMAGTDGRKAIEALIAEGKQIVKDYDQALNSPFEQYRENQRQWASTDAVRDMEDVGDRIIEKMILSKSEADSVVLRSLKQRQVIGSKMWKSLESKLLAQWSVWHVKADREERWKLPEAADKMHRRILLEPDLHWKDHTKASYQGGLDRDRERRDKEREERERKVRKELAAAKGEEGGEEEKSESEGEEENAVDTTREGESDSEEGENWNVVEQDDSGDEFAWAKQSFVWEAKEKVLMHSEVILVRLEKSVRGNLLLTNFNIYFHPEKELGSEVGEMLAGDLKGEKDVRWELKCITGVYGRRYILRPQALEVFFAGDSEVFLSFEGGAKVRDKFWQKLRGCRLMLMGGTGSISKSLNPRARFKKSNVTDLWRRRKISNFEYLMRLNVLAGRSFNDITQYPVFPWILNDYTSETIDLSDPKVYRDLTKPIGALNEKRLQSLLERYYDMDGMDMDGYNFLYGTHYSSPGFVLHYMLRQEPFTTMAISLQGGRFDCPDRLFFDVAASWQSTTSNSGDFKEAIPELFFCPEMLMNSNKLPLGELQVSPRTCVN